jgi:predicted RNase H-like HicB family nuclease
MRRFPRPFSPDNDTAPKNDLGIPEAGHKRLEIWRRLGYGGGGHADRYALLPSSERSILRQASIALEDAVTSYAVVIERASDGGYGAWSPDLPGVVALGDAEAEALDEMRRAIQFHLDGLREDGRPIPHPATVAAAVITLDVA